MKYIVLLYFYKYYFCMKFLLKENLIKVGMKFNINLISLDKNFVVGFWIWVIFVFLSLINDLIFLN